MKKFVAPICVATIAMACSGLTGEVNACDNEVRSGRVVYSQPSHVVYSTPVVQAPQVIHTSKVVRRPTVVTQTIEKREIIAVEKRTLEIEVGSIVKAKVRFAGREEGEVTVKSGNIELSCRILEWTQNRVTFQLPDLQVQDDAEVSLTIFKATGVVAKRVDALVLTEPSFRIEPVSASISRASKGNIR